MHGRESRDSPDPSTHAKPPREVGPPSVPGLRTHACPHCAAWTAASLVSITASPYITFPLYSKTCVAVGLGCNESGNLIKFRIPALASCHSCVRGVQNGDNEMKVDIPRWAICRVMHGGRNKRSSLLTSTIPATRMPKLRIKLFDKTVHPPAQSRSTWMLLLSKLGKMCKVT